MSNRYSRNRIYIDEQAQETIKGYPIIIGGSGIGSVIAECALRLGFENMTIVDGDRVEQSNLNRQNYTGSDVGTTKTSAIQTRLQAINKDAIINVHDYFITEENIEELVNGHKAAINALDFTSDIPFQFDKICKAHKIPVLHPYNLGWGGLAIVIEPEGMPLTGIANNHEKFNELTVVEYVSSQLKYLRTLQIWLDRVIESIYKKKRNYRLPNYLLHLGSLQCAHIFFSIWRLVET